MANTLIALLKESAERFRDVSDGTGAFEEELRRMEKYDSQICPEKLRPAINFCKEKGFKPIDLLAQFGERNFIPNLALIARAYIELANIADKHNSKLENNKFNIVASEALQLKRWGGHWQDSKYINKYQDGSEKCEGTRSLNDKIEGFTGFTGMYDYYRNKQQMPQLKVTGFFEGDRGNCYAGTITLDGFEETTLRRFNYIFGMSPATEAQIVDTLITLNGFKKGEAEYELREEELKSLNPPRAATLLYKEAIGNAKEKGLFAEVKAYRLSRRQNWFNDRDPVIIGLDQFRNRYPIIYWGGKKDD